MKAHKIPKLTIAEYREQEVTTGIKYEYHDGEIYALAGGSINHATLCGNIYSELRNGLKNKNSNCRPFTSEIKLNIESKNSFVYPDSIVICGDIETSKNDENAVINPVLIVEVLSKSTSDYDRGDKFHLYRQIEGLQEYVLIAQDKPVVEVFFKKTGTDLWSINRIEGLEKVIELNSINLKIEMSELYLYVKLDSV